MKKKLRELFEKHGGKVFIGTIAFFVVGFGIFILGGYLAGWDVFGWLKTPQAILVYCLILFALGVIACIWKWTRDHKEGV